VDVLAQQGGSIVGDSTAVGSNEFLDHRTARRDHFGGDKQCAQLLLVEYQTTSLACLAATNSRA
jgi:hypothetical protein